MSNFKIETDDEGIPSDPQHQPHSVHYEVSRSVLHSAKDSQDDRHDVQEVGQNGCPLVSQEVEDLPFQGCDQLHAAEADQRAPPVALRHGVNPQPVGGEGLLQALSPGAVSS